MDSNDGVFFMEFGQFKATFPETYLSKDTSDWHHDYFLKLGDSSASYNSGSVWTYHKLRVSSQVTQSVYVTVHTWDRNLTSKSCDNVLDGTNKRHYARMQHSSPKDF